MHLKFPRTNTLRTILLTVIFHIFLLYPIHGMETEFRTSTGVIRLESFHPVESWKGLDQASARALAPYLVDYWSSTGRTRSIELWMDGARNGNVPIDPAVLALATGITGRGSQGLLNGEERDRLEFYQTLLKVRSGTPLGRGDLPALQKICKQTGFSMECKAVELREKLEEINRSARLDEGRMGEIMGRLRPFLSRNTAQPPFVMELLSGLPGILARIGLPLEAAILSERSTSDNPGEGAKPIRELIPVYLAMAGDFPSALNYLDRFQIQGDRNLKISAVDWSILGNDFKRASQMLSRDLEGTRAGGDDDFWTGFPSSPDTSRLKLAMLLYLSGDRKEGAEGLEKIRGSTIVNRYGEPLGQYARLRLAQFLLEENPELAHKIAEDMVYLAQAKDWYHLEYHATVLEGWSLLESGSTYKALISFIKAGGILRGEKTRPEDRYSWLVGILKTRVKLNPAGNYDAIIHSIQKTLSETPYHRAIYQLGFMTPSMATPEDFMEVAIYNQKKRKKGWKALSWTVNAYRERLLQFDAGKNPGGLRGLSGVLIWSKRLELFSAMGRLKKSLGFSPDHTGLPGLSATLAGRLAPSEINSSWFKRGSSYLFSFKHGDRRRIFLVYPSATGRRGKIVASIRTIWVPEDKIQEFAGRCSFPVGGKGCKLTPAPLKHLAEVYKSAKSIYLLALYSPELDLDWGAVLAGGRSIPRDVVFFYHPSPFKDRAPGNFPIAYREEGCASDVGLGRVEPVSLLTGPMTGESKRSDLESGFLVWPTGLDEPKGKNGEKRPVYLRNFVCGDRSLRFWDMDRYAEQGARVVIYRSRPGEVELNRAFARYFAEKGSILFEYSGDWNAAAWKELEERARGQWKNGAGKAMIRAAYPTRRSFPGIESRVILPGIP